MRYVTIPTPFSGSLPLSIRESRTRPLLLTAIQSLALKKGYSLTRR